MHPRPPLQQELFGTPAPRLPPGMRYEEEVLDLDEEAHWLQVVAGLPLHEMRYKQYTARRRGASFGGSYDFDANRLDPAEPLPAALQPLRDRVAAWAGLPPDRFVHALAAEYRPGTPLGWHRDVPDFEDIVGVSLGAPAVMRFRPWPHEPGRRASVLKLEVAPRSVYLLRGESRWDWQHSVAPTQALRYSVTFRTARSGG
jgi:alkylated DNA repair dioxygenase AlkB